MSKKAYSYEILGTTFNPLQMIFKLWIFMQVNDGEPRNDIF